jgi:GNAT superfamily N-acetyltransferase
MTGAPTVPGLVVVGAEPYDATAAVALVADLEAEIEIRYADDVPEDGGDPEEAAAWAVRPEQVTPPAGVFLVARIDGVPVGCGALRPALDGTPGLAEVKRMYTRPEARRRGVSRAILARLEDAARAFGYRRIQLETGTRQPEAMTLYEAAGYHRIEPYGEFRDDPLSVCYAKDLHR